jgi:hypothetical protein
VDRVTGYLHPRYAQSLAEFGIPLELPRCGGWILQRRIPGFPYYDAMGCYPLFACREWSQLFADLEEIGGELVSLSVVTDPFGEYSAAYLRRCFRDAVKPFKKHYTVDLRCSMSSYVSRHHRRYARKALRHVHVERCQDPMQFVEEWANLYAALIKRHDIQGIPAFSQASLAKQLTVPGIVVFRVVHRDTTVGMALWYAQGEVGYYHLGAYNEAGYELRASFALFWCAIEYFATEGLRWLNLGAGAGVEATYTDGLTRFKRGWSTGTRTAYLCGRIFDRTRYSGISNTRNVSVTRYFPAYREGEFG